VTAVYAPPLALNSRLRRPARPRTWWRGWDDVLGMNARNERIDRENPRPAVRLVNDKHATKAALTAVGAPTAPTLHVVRSRRELATFRWEELPDAWALKPNQSLGGNGIVIAAGREGATSWQSASGRTLDTRELGGHLQFLLDGEYSPRSSDWALFEPLLRSHDDLARISHRGLADVRVICVGDEPRLAMARLPTSGSGGRANLHQGAIGAAVDLATGRITAARLGDVETPVHPYSGAPIVGAVVPHWGDVLDAASRCADATGLSYLGADIVVDADHGALVLEVNARPGLQIQNVAGTGLVGRLHAA
jgi:alpha-L-glutamate ligase-like protein